MVLNYISDNSAKIKKEVHYLVWFSHHNDRKLLQNITNPKVYLLGEVAWIGKFNNSI
jgi:hypothetical protein